MVFVVTLVASQMQNLLTIGHIAEVETILQERGIALAGGPVWLNKNMAADIPFTGKPSSDDIKTLRAFLNEDKIDVFITGIENRRKKLVIADMDSTIVSGETLDELAAHAGVKDKIAPITERAMRGELDFKQALRARVALLKDLPETALAQTLAQTNLNPGADILIRNMKNTGATCVLVSGGFTQFTAAFAQKAGFDHHHGNLLHIENGLLTGEVGEPILDKDSKVTFMQYYMDELNLTPGDVLAIGDGANDLPMLETAGLGIGYHPKPLLRDTLDNCIIHGDLTAALYAQGFRAVA